MHFPLTCIYSPQALLCQGVSLVCNHLMLNKMKDYPFHTWFRSQKRKETPNMKETSINVWIIIYPEEGNSKIKTKKTLCIHMQIVLDRFCVCVCVCICACFQYFKLLFESSSSSPSLFPLSPYWRRAGSKEQQFMNILANKISCLIATSYPFHLPRQ